MGRVAPEVVGVEEELHVTVDVEVTKGETCYDDVSDEKAWALFSECSEGTKHLKVLVVVDSKKPPTPSKRSRGV